MSTRHKLAWLSDAGWQAAIENAGTSAPHQRVAMDQWRRADWPAVIRRTDADAADHEVCLGIALPPHPTDGSKIRIAFRAAKSEVKKILDPIRIGVAAAAAPDAWRANLVALDAETERQGLSIRVYGSLALQALTGQHYVTPASDIDLLFYPATVAQLGTGIALLAVYRNVLPLDGEIVFPSGQAVAWTEWLNAMQGAATPRVLVKGNKTVHLSTMAELLHSLEQPACAH
jgi:phosphoribosyl-dephospho-CoA transferase